MMNLPPIKYARTSDGYHIAYRVMGQGGPPLLFIPPPLIDLDSVWRFFSEWMEGLVSRFRLIQYDMRGQGLSTRGLPADLTMADFGRDLEAVADAAGYAAYYVWGWAMPSHLAVRYAVQHPDRVLALILNTSSIAGEPWGRVQFDLLPQENWEGFLRMIVPSGLSAEETRQRVRLLSESMNRRDWDVACRASRASTVWHELTEVTVPALVLHPRRWHSVSLEDARQFAALMPDARFQVIEGSYIYGHAADGLAAIDAFMAELKLGRQDGFPPGKPNGEAGLSDRELEVLRLLAAGKSNAQIAEALVITTSTVAKHVTSILAKTEAANRTDAAGFAHRNGLA